MPFITEEIYLKLINNDESIMISKWPKYSKELEFDSEETKIELIMDIIKAVRNIRSNMNVPPSKKAKLIMVCSAKECSTIMEGKGYFERLAYASEIEVISDKSGIPANCVSVVVPGVEIYIPMNELVDIQKEVERLQKEKENLEKELQRVDGLLGNERFVSKAPPKVIEEEKEKKVKYQDMMNKVVERINELTSI
jgi:valyl-tRNA synthetase